MVESIRNKPYFYRTREEAEVVLTTVQRTHPEAIVRARAWMVLLFDARSHRAAYAGLVGGAVPRPMV